MRRRTKHEMIFTSYPDTTTADPTTLVAHKLTAKDLDRYDSATGHFRGQMLRFSMRGIWPKVGDFIVRFGDNLRFPVADGVVTLVYPRRFYTIIGDMKALNELGMLMKAAEKEEAAEDAECS
jgi:hypothetical protein